MPKFFFHLENTATVRDAEGVELDDLEAAKCHAITLIGQTLCAHPKGFWEADTYQVTVSDENGLTLFTVAMMSVMAPVMTPGLQLKPGP